MKNMTTLRLTVMNILPPRPGASQHTRPAHPCGAAFRDSLAQCPAGEFAAVARCAKGERAWSSLSSSWLGAKG